jgi:hypothetical protein
MHPCVIAEMRHVFSGLAMRCCSPRASCALITSFFVYSLSFSATVAIKLANDLYVCPRPTPLTSLIATVAENERLYTKKDVIKAQEARGLQQRMANPSNTRLISAITHGCIVAPSVTLTADLYWTADLASRPTGNFK